MTTHSFEKSNITYEDTNVVNNMAIRNVIAEAYTDLIVRDRLEQAIQTLHTASTQYLEGIDVKTSQPREYFDGICSAFRLLKKAEESLKHHLAIAVLSSPALRRYVIRVPDPPEILKLRMTLADDDKVCYQMCHLLECIHGKDRDHLIDVLTFVDALGTLLRLGPNITKYFSPRANRGLMQLAIVTEFLLLFSTQPCGDKVEHFCVITKTAPASDKETQAVTEWLMKLREVDYAGIEQLGNPARRRFSYPSDKSPTESKVNARIEAEENLRIFWQAADARIEECTGSQAMGAVKELFLTSGGLRSTIEWERPRSPSPPNEHGESTAPVSFPHDSAADITGHFKKLDVSTNAKEKTRGQANPNFNNAEIRGAAPPLAELESFSFEVDDEMYGEFSTLLAMDDKTGSRKVRWTSFVRAMTKLGFSAMHLAGSSWTFQPRREPSVALGTRPISFHQPHPSPDLDFYHARVYGRRLSRAYGLEGGMFVLKDK